jgi:hypothetical protein
MTKSIAAHGGASNRRLRVNLEQVALRTRWPCDFCGGHTDKVDALPAWYDGDGDRHYLCDECVVAGNEGIRPRLLNFAEVLERWAQDLRSLSEGGDWELPSIEEIAEARFEAEKAFFEEADYLRREEERLRADYLRNEEERLRRLHESQSAS